MKKSGQSLILLIFILSNFSGYSQHEKDNACYIWDNRINFVIDRRWSKEKIRDFENSFNLDSLIVNAALQSKDSVIVKDSVNWTVTQIPPFRVSLSKPLLLPEMEYNQSDILLFDDIIPATTLPQTNRSNNRKRSKGYHFLKYFSYFPSNYGTNASGTERFFEFRNDTARFILNDYKEASRVILAGSFNNWSTMRLEMNATSEGWEIEIPLKPGKHQYKYIVDGWWVTDPLNPQTEPDGQGGLNSVIYAYNYTFKLTGFPKARKIFVAGSFNNWNARELSLLREDRGVWSRTLYLNPGTHAYKYVVDRQWIIDPQNKIIRTDGNGNSNSYLGIGDTAIFRLNGFENSNTVYLAGNFNAWNPNELLMNRIAGGWELPMALSPGIYEYKFIIDGTWITDPDNSATSGRGDYANSILTFLPNHTFVLSGFSEAEKVFVTGSFNGWRHDGYVMQRQNGQWVCPVYLNSGKHTYKFIVDGQWMIDPANEIWESNNQGTGNSVLWID